MKSIKQDIYDIVFWHAAAVAALAGLFMLVLKSIVI